MSYRANIESEILAHTEWLVDPNSNRGGRRDAVGGSLGHQQPGTEGTGSTRGRWDAIGVFLEPRQPGRGGTEGRASNRGGRREPATERTGWTGMVDQ